MYIADTEDVAYTEEDLANHHGVAALIFNKRGEILIQDHVKYGFWTIPVGKAKPGQSPEEAVVEEIGEECGVELLNFEELTTFTRTYIRGGKKVEVIAHIFEVIEYKGKPMNVELDKHKKQIFMSIEHIRELDRLSDVTIEMLKIFDG